MYRLILICSLLFFLFSCSKKEENNIFWEQSFGTGKAVSIKVTPDSDFVSCGQINNAPYFIKLDRNGKMIIDYTCDNHGLYTSVLIDGENYFLGGNTSGKMFLTRLDSAGRKVWEKSVNSTFRVYKTILFKTVGETFLGIGTANADSAVNLSAGLLFAWFDSAGTIISQRQINQGLFLSANDAAIDNSGNIYLALTRKETGSRSKAGVAKWNSNLQKIWETELYNNPDFGAASLGLELDNAGIVYVSGFTELPSGNKSVYNSFLVKLDNAGTVKWKKYLESSNSGAEVILDKDGNLMLLNRNCFLTDILSPVDGSAFNKIRPVDACDSDNTDAFGWDIKVIPGNNVIFSGSKGSSFYIAIKPSGSI
jgi:hypothetical protein